MHDKDAWEFFATFALHAIISRPDTAGECEPTVVAERAGCYADAMLSERKKRAHLLCEKSIKSLVFSVRTTNILSRLGVFTIKQLTQLTEKQILNCRNSGQTTLNEIIAKLDMEGLSLAPEAGDQDSPAH